MCNSMTRHGGNADWRNDDCHEDPNHTHSRRRVRERKTAQLCSQAQRALGSVIQNELLDADLSGLAVVDVCLDDPRTARRLFAGLGELVPVVKHRSRVEADEALWSRSLSCDALQRLRDREGLVQLGTLGRGNHFLELQSGDDGRYWLMVHSGSRAMGPRVRDHHLRRCETSRGGFRYLSADTTEGRAHLGDRAPFRRTTESPESFPGP